MITEKELATTIWNALLENDYLEVCKAIRKWRGDLSCLHIWQCLREKGVKMGHRTIYNFFETGKADVITIARIVYGIKLLKEEKTCRKKRRRSANVYRD